MASSVLVERSFEVRVRHERTWELLAEVERWPEWALHIRTANLEGGGLGPESEGRFTFRPAGSARFRMTSWRPPASWTWHGRALGLPIDYHHHFQAPRRRANPAHVDRRARRRAGRPAGEGLCPCLRPQPRPGLARLRGVGREPGRR